VKEIELKYKYVIKAKKRPSVNFRTRSIANLSADDEHAIAHDTKLQLTKSQIKEIYDSKYVSFEVINYYGTTQKKLHGTPKETKPDCDNFTKLWSDAVNSILWDDDGKVFKMTGTKYWGASSHSRVIIKYGGYENETTKEL
jgi:Holliday junction resolvase RusA-like endonuclease